MRISDWSSDVCSSDVVPNRRGLWARSDRTPLGWGHPYSAAQLSRVLRDNMFTPTRTQRALYVPPIGNYTFLRSAPAWERSEEHTSELQSLMRISYAVFCLKKKTQKKEHTHQP